MKGFDEVTVAGCHREVDGVEVLLTLEAADQVPLRIEVRSTFAPPPSYVRHIWSVHHRNLGLTAHDDQTVHRKWSKHLAFEEGLVLLDVSLAIQPPTERPWCATMCGMRVSWFLSHSLPYSGRYFPAKYCSKTCPDRQRYLQRRRQPKAHDQRRCNHCCELFQPERSTAQFCSDKCRVYVSRSRQSEVSEVS